MKTSSYSSEVRDKALRYASLSTETLETPKLLLRAEAFAKYLHDGLIVEDMNELKYSLNHLERDK